jgi:hypothetical protein
MPSVTLRYRLHFIIFFAFTIFLVAGWLYPMVATWRPIWRIVGKPWWFVILIEIVGVGYFGWMTYITSFELGLEDTGLFVKRPWGRFRMYRFVDIASLSAISRRTSLVRTNQGNWIPLSGLTADGLQRKQQIERTLLERLPQPR